MMRRSISLGGGQVGTLNNGDNGGQEAKVQGRIWVQQGMDGSEKGSLK